MEREMVTTVDATKRTRGGTRRRWRFWFAAAVLTLVVLGAGLFGMGAMTGDHTLASVTYAQVPPNEGEHSPVWQRCGFYAEPVGDEHAIHSLEHGAVWITYRPDLAAADVDHLRELARAYDELIVSPYPTGLSAPIVVSAWGWQVPVDPVGWTQIDDAIRAARAGAEPPEPGAGCEGPNLWLTGGTGSPES